MEDDPRLLRLVDGTLSRDELARLEREAAVDPRLSQAIEAYRPLDPGARAKITARILCALSNR